MKILSIGTSGKNCTVAISEDKKTLKEININTGLTHSETLLPSIDQLFKDTNLSLSQIDIYAVSIGPGSFTGIRIGIATLKGICLAHNKPIVPVPSLLGLAYNVKNFEGYIVSCIDARNDNVYAGIYKKSSSSIEQVEDYISDNVQKLVDAINALNSPVFIVGDGANCLKTALEKSNSTLSILYSSSEDNIEFASSIAIAAFDLYEKNIITDDIHLTPLYLKKSQAERELEEKQ